MFTCILQRATHAFTQDLQFSLSLSPSLSPFLSPSILLSFYLLFLLYSLLVPVNCVTKLLPLYSNVPCSVLFALFSLSHSTPTAISLPLSLSLSLSLPRTLDCQHWAHTNAQIRDSKASEATLLEQHHTK